MRKCFKLMVVGSLLGLIGAGGTVAAAAADEVHSARIVSSSDDLQLTKSDHSVGIKRAAGSAHKMVARLPADAQPDQEFVIDDLAGDFSSAWVTVFVPDGHTIRNERKFDLTIDGGHTTFRYFGEKTWGVEQ